MKPRKPSPAVAALLAETPSIPSNYMVGRTRKPGNRSARKRLWIYFAEALTVDAIKIGISKHPMLRMDAIRCGSPVPVVLMLVVRGSASTEYRLHQRFADERLHGEWFRASARLRALIAELAPLNEQEIDAVLRARRTRSASRVLSLVAA